MPWPLSPDSKGPWEVLGTRLCRRKDILPVRAAHTTEAAAPRRPSSQQGQRRWGVSGWAQSPPSLASQGVSLFKSLRVSGPLS